jgi:periplasmic divalent cation tolerance protein
VRSVYHWKGKVEDSREFLLLVKTSRVHLDDLHKEITRLHSYAVPEFIALPIVAGSADYLSWFAEATQRPARSRAKI